MMNKKTQQLSEQGQRRKQSMLTELQNEIQLQHSKRQRRTLSIVASLCLLLVSVLGYQLANKNMDQTVQSNLNKTVPGNRTEPRTFQYGTVESNRASVSHRYVDSRSSTRLQFEAMSDEELASALQTNGDKLVLAEIDGQKILIPSRL